MDLPKNHTRHLILFFFKKSVSAENCQDQINQVWPNAVSRTCVYDWYRKFRLGDFSLEDKDGRGRKPEIDLDVLKDLVESEPKQSLREMASIMEVSHETIRSNLNRIGKVLRSSVWVPHELFSANKL
jgi:transposase